MKKIIILFNVFVFTYTFNYSQTGWVREYENKIANTFTHSIDNRFILAGAEYDAMQIKWNVFKTDSSGNVKWDDIFYDQIGTVARCMLSTPDTGFIITGNGYLKKYSKNNVSSWYRGKYAGMIHSIISMDDTSYLFTGNIESPTTGLIIGKINTKGDSLWTKTYFKDTYNEGVSLVKYDDSSYYCLSNKSILLKLNEFGDTLWTKSINNTINAKEMIMTADSCFLIGGNKNEQKLSFTKINHKGEVFWSKNYGSNYTYNYNTSVAKTFDGGFITANYMQSSDQYPEDYLWIMKLNAQGDSIWSIKKTDKQFTTDKIIQTKDSLYVFLANDRYGKPWLIKTDSTGNILMLTNINNIKRRNVLNIYPNPATNTLTVNINKQYSNIQLEIVDETGRSVYHKNYLNNPIYLNNYSKGIYFMKLTIDNKQFVKKIIVN